MTSWGDHLRRTTELTLRLTMRDFEARYRGSILGVGWAFLTPLLTALIFTFVFSSVFQARWGTGRDGVDANFTLILLVGVLLHSMLAETLNRAAGLILAHSSYVKKVVFPLGTLPVVVVLGALITAAFGLLIVILGHALYSGRVEATAPLFILIIIPYLLLLLASAYVLSALGVYLRDIGQIVSFVVTASMFLTPIFYPISSVPPSFRTLMQLNPLTIVVEETRSVLLFGQAPNWQALAFLWMGALVALPAAIWVFNRLRAGFADVL
ncbi:ABC transporter permease [Bosea sp. BIWAKO-01]|uniref:ABC transporter permease n=1 Tax=Bosea sp. BIWAKO-01 TaxID=506668 RepID=UPI000A665FE8|nr:ABC transporter permease [Bosea sp. BIWAKO-01]